MVIKYMAKCWKKEKVKEQVLEIYCQSLHAINYEIKFMFSMILESINGTFKNFSTYFT